MLIKFQQKEPSSKFILFQNAITACWNADAPRVIVRGDDSMFWVVSPEEGDNLIKKRMFQKVRA